MGKALLQQQMQLVMQSGSVITAAVDGVGVIKIPSAGSSAVEFLVDEVIIIANHLRCGVESFQAVICMNQLSGRDAAFSNLRAAFHLLAVYGDEFTVSRHDANAETLVAIIVRKPKK